MHCDLDLLLFDPEIDGAHPHLMGSLHVKFYFDTVGVKGKQLCVNYHFQYSLYCDLGL